MKVSVTLIGPVTVGFVEKPDVVWVSEDSRREELMDELENAQMNMIHDVRVGDVAATVFSEDGALYRVTLLSVVGNEVEVRYCDYGNVEKKGMDELFKLPDKLAKPAALAVRLRVEGVTGVGDSAKNRARVEKKLSVEGLMVKVVDEDKDGLVGTFEVGGKKIKFSKNKDLLVKVETDCTLKQETNIIANEIEKKGDVKTEIKEAKKVIKENPKLVPDTPTAEVEQSEEIADETVSAVKVSASSGSPVMFAQLPNIKLLEGVEISGTVVYVSPLGGVWFCPQWIQAPLDNLTVHMDAIQAEGNLKNIESSQLKEGLLVIVKSSNDGDLYRARVVTVGQKITVNYVDFGDTDIVASSEVFSFPSGLDMLAPSAAEVVLARELPKQKTKEVLEESLMEVENLVLVMKMDTTGARVGKFYDGVKEINWDHMLEARMLFEKERIDAENNAEDVIIESETVVESVNVLTEKKQTQAATEKVPVPVIELARPTPPKLIRMVIPIPLALLVEVPVFIVHVESVNRMWVCRDEDEVRISLMMDMLARMSEALKPAQKIKIGAVYGARFSKDGEMYRAVLKENEDGRAVVLFIDFGNMESKTVEELYDIPEDIGKGIAAAVVVEVKNDMEDTEDNRAAVEDMLDGENVTVTVKEGGAVFKIGGQEVQFTQQTSKKNRSVLTSSEEMVTIEDIQHQSNEGIATMNDLKQTSREVVIPRADETTSLSSDAKPHSSTLVPPSNLKDKLRASPALSIPVTPQPVPTRTFAKAISALQSQLLVRHEVTSSKKTTDKDVKTIKVDSIAPACMWSPGDPVVARWPDGIWRQASIVMVDTTAGQAIVTSEGVEEVKVSLLNVRSHSLPVEALNQIEQGVKRDTIVRQKGDGATIEKKIKVAPATVVGKVKEWMDKNMEQMKVGRVRSTLDVEGQLSPPLDSTSKHSLEQIPLPPCQDLAAYSRTSKGSLHIQSVLNITNQELSSSVLTSLLTSSIDPFSLMTSPKSSYVIQKLITVLPSQQLQPLLSVILTNFTQLSLDSSGCRVVQSMLELSSPDQKRSITTMICNTKILLTLVADQHGTYVAQACLPHLTPSPTSLLALVNCLLGYTATLGQHQQGTYFMQRLVGVLSTHYPGSGAACLLQEDILANLKQLVVSEAGSRLVQAMLKDTQPNTLVRVARWVEENKKAVIVTKPAVFVALAVVQQIVARLGEEGSWTSMLERMVRSHLDQDMDCSSKQSVLITAALHPVGHLLARELVLNVKYVGEKTKMDVMTVLACEVDRLSADKFGAVVLKGLAESAI